jgi:hypothetical protein
VGDPLAEHRLLGVLDVGMDRVPVAGEAGKLDDIGLGDRASRGDEGFPDLIIL